MNPRKFVLNVVDGDPDNKVHQLPRVEFKRSKSTVVGDFSRRNLTPKVRDQGSIGSCVGHSGRVVMGGAEEYIGVDLSPMWIYKKAKIHDVFPGEDYSGTTILGACIALAVEGCCEERFYPYTDSEDSVMAHGAAHDAATRRIADYYKISMDRVDEIQELLATESLWVSFDVHEKFYSTGSEGIVPSEGYVESPKAGGHAVALTGWKHIDGRLYWEFQNSWGSFWGNKGFFYIEKSLFEKIVHGGAYFLVTQEEKKKSVDTKIKYEEVKPSIFKKFINMLKKLFRKK